MADEDQTAPKPFAEFMLEHNRGSAHTEASEALQRVVAAVADTLKKGTVVITVSVEPMKNNPDAMLTVIDVKAKPPTQAPKAAIFYADGDGNLSRNDPGQLPLVSDDLREPARPELRDAPGGGQ